jgi:hypothetical protein
MQIEYGEGGSSDGHAFIGGRIFGNTVPPSLSHTVPPFTVIDGLGNECISVSLLQCFFLH